MTKEKLIRVFTVDGPPYMLSYQYRRKDGGGHKEDLPALKELMKEGTVKMVEKTTKRILYKYEPKANK